MLNNIYVRAVGLVLIVIVVVIVVIDYFYLDVHRRNLEDDLERQLSITGNAVVDRFRNDMIDGRHRKSFEIIDFLKYDPNVLNLAILSTDGSILYSTPPDMGGEIVVHDTVFSHVLSGSSVVLSGEKRLTVFQPIYNMPECYSCHPHQERIAGIMQIQYSTSVIEKRLNALKWSLYGLAGIIAIMISLFVYVIHGRILRRKFVEISSVMQRIESGDLRGRVDDSGSNELSRLAKSFNAMIARLEAARNEIARITAEELERADRLATIGEIASGIAHELKNPLAGITGTAQVLYENADEEDPQKEILSEMVRELKRIDSILRDMLSYAALPQPQMMKTDINELLVRSLDFVLRSAGDKQITVSKTLADELPVIYLDQGQAEQVFTNIILNAVQVIGQVGTIHLSTRDRPDRGAIEVRIADSGGGVPIETVADIFKPFVTTKHRGTGLGLAICKGIMEKHNGYLELENRIGSGAVFIAGFPIEVSKAADADTDC